MSFSLVLLLSLSWVLLFGSVCIVVVSGQNCNGCSDTSQCHVFDATDDSFLGCYGTFTGGASGLSGLCGTGFVVPNASYASTLGFTQTMCENVATQEIFWLAESGIGLYCNDNFDTSDTKGLWGCSGGSDTSFGSTCKHTGNYCVGITDYYCEGVDFDNSNGTRVIDIATPDDEFNTLSLLDASYGGAVCIRAPTLAPTNMPTNMPSDQPTLNPSNMPTALPTLVPSMPTKAPTDGASSILDGKCVLISTIIIILYAAFAM